MSWLAFLAVLLMTAMPTIGRIVASVAPQATPVLMEMCTTAGRSLVDVSPFIAPEAPARPMQAMAEACDYCTLLPPLQLVLLVLCAQLLRPPPHRRARSYRIVPRAVRNLRGLGSQAPPVAC